MQNLRDREISAVSKMLTLSSSYAQHSVGTGTYENFNDQWKILIYDQDCRDIISPLMNVGALRQKGVTLHMLLHSEREAIPDAPAVYFVRPTEANIKRISEDCAKQLYRTVYLNFLTRIERPLIEKLAQELVANNCVSLVSKIYDQYLDVIALEPTLFTLNIKDSFMAYNETSLTEAQIRSFMSTTASGLLSMVRVLGSIPIIRAPTGAAAEMLAHEFNSLLKENISSRGPAQALFEDCLVGDRPRPLLLIFDRSSDFFPILQHTSKYQALISDLLDYKLNRVTIDIPEKDASKTKKKTYDLNTQSDPFLSRFAGSPFPEAIDANEKELAEVSQREKDIRSRPDVGQGAETANPLDGKGKDLSEAIESLPEILNKKMNLEAHTNILHAVMKKVAQREVPTYFELEQNILTSGGRVSDRAAVLSLLRDGQKGLLSDKARLLALLAVTTDGCNKAVCEEYDAAFLQGCSSLAAPTSDNGSVSSHQQSKDKALAAVAFLRRLVALQSSSSRMGGMSSVATAGGATNAILSTFINTAHSRATSLMAKAASFFTKFTPFCFTRVVDNLAEGRSCPEDETFLYLDPRGNIPASGGRGEKYSDVIVFVLGGGCHSEFFNLQELLKEKGAGSGAVLRNVMYGCTELLSGDDFMDQLERLSQPKSISADVKK